jgi:tripartite-type tricarboxylate transporter receptor subunit TctC
MKKTTLPALLLAAALPLQWPAHAQTWPAKPIRVIVPFAPGGPADIVARVAGQKMGEGLGQPVVIENRAGAGGNIGAAAVAKSAPDGYTVLLTTSAFAVNVTLFPNPGYEEREFIPTALLASQPNMIYVHPGVTAKTLGDLVASAKSGKLAYGSPGVGTTPHLTAENLFRIVAKLDTTPIHFKGAGPMVTAVMTGEPNVGSGAISGPIAQIRAGKLRGLAVSSGKRLAALPDVPTFAEAGFPGIEDYTWIALFFPAGTPVSIVQKTNEVLNSVTQSADFRERMGAVAFDPMGGSLQQASDFVKSEIVKWGKVVKETGARPD